MQIGREFMKALRELIEEKNLSEDVIIASLEAALASAYRKYKEGNMDPVVRIDIKSGDIEILDVRRVSESEKLAEGEVTVEQAEKLGFPGVKNGDLIKIPVVLHPERFGRIAAQTARQVIIQRLKDAERQIVFDQFADKIGDLVSGVIFKSENDQVLVRIDARTEAILPKEERIVGEKYVLGATMSFFLLDVRQTTKGPRIIVSRTHPGLLRRLMERGDIPEITDGTVEIKGIVREAGTRAKVAVYSENPSVDPVGSCVGPNGARIKKISSELHDEKIDIIVWSEDPVVFVQNALSPAKPIKIEIIDGAEKTARVYCSADQLSLAIGKAGQNVRLAARLTGWKVDINTVAPGEDVASDLSSQSPEEAI